MSHPTAAVGRRRTVPPRPMLPPPTWAVLAARSACALRLHASPAFPADLTGACQVAAVLLALVGDHAGEDVLLDCGRVHLRGLPEVHCWNLVRRRIVDLTATQYGVEAWVHLGDRRTYRSKGTPLRSHEAAPHFYRLRDLWHPCCPNHHYRVLVPALAEATGMSHSTATLRVHDLIGPPA